MVNTLITGGNGPERHEYIKNYLDSLLKENEDIIIFDATYSFGLYNVHKNVRYYSADHSLNYIEDLKRVNEGNKKTYIVSDIYGGLFFSKTNKELMISLLKKKDLFSVTFYTRHLSYVPESFLEYFDNRIDHDDIMTIIANK